MLVSRRHLTRCLNQLVRAFSAPNVVKGVKSTCRFFRSWIFFLGIAEISVYFATVSARDSATASC